MEKITKQDILIREFNKHFEKKIMKEFEIAFQKELNPDEISAKKPLRFASNGQPMSWQEISRKDYIQILEKELEMEELILKVIKDLEI